MSNNFKNWKTFSLWILFSEAVGFTAGILTREATQIYANEIIKPFLAPPSILFPVVWTLLYALMGYGVAKIFLSPKSKQRTQGLTFFFIQLFLNFCWCFLFFSFQEFGLAFFWLLALIAAVIFMAKYFYKINTLAAYFQIPYILWLIFAAYLNFSVWILN